MKKYWLLLLSGLTLRFVAAQGQAAYTPRETQVRLETGTFLTGGQPTPFWLRVNQFGQVPLSAPAATVRGAVHSDYTQLKSDTLRVRPKRFDWGYGLAVTGNAAGSGSQLLLPEAYLKARYGHLEIYAGRRREIIGLTDTTMSSGAYIWSGNALPLPKVQISTVGFTPIPFTHSLLAVYGVYAHGWFGNQKRVQGSYLHQKMLYFRLGKPSWPVRAYAGLNHQVQWGGYSPYLSNAVSNNGYLPSRLNDYWNAVIAKEGVGYFDTSLSTMETNRIGNHLGTVDLGLELQAGRFNLLVYRQNIYDDGSLFNLTNLRDGLNGLRIRNSRPRAAVSLRSLTAEFLYTRHQGGPVFSLERDDPSIRGRDDYFNHSQYIDGWRYQGQNLGSAFLTPGVELRPGLPNGPIANNRLTMVYLGAAGSLPYGLTWQARVSYSQNIGTYNAPFPRELTQWSSYVSLLTPITLPAVGLLQLHTAVAVDRGEVLPTSTGVYLGLSKQLTSGGSAPPRPASTTSRHWR